MLLVVGCGVSTEDVEATVQARIARIPTPTPQIIIVEVEKEVVKEVEVVVESEAIKEVEVIKEVPVEVEKIVEKIVEVEVEKIVEVRESGETVYIEVTPTPTPTPLPTPTATPMPDPLEYISMETSSGTTKDTRLYEDLTAVIPTAGKRYIDVVIINTHPSEKIQLVGRLSIEEKDSDGYIVSQETKYLDGNDGRWKTCLEPNKSYRFRYADLNTELVTADFEFETALFGCGMEEDIDETLIDEVEIDIQRLSPYGFSIEIRNNSEHTIKWGGDLLITDEYGNIIRHSQPSSWSGVGLYYQLQVIPNGIKNRFMHWEGQDNFVQCNYIKLCFRTYYLDMSWTGPLSHNWTYGDFTTDLKINEATLKTIQLIKVD